jgi:hypothetical protein
MNILSFIYFIVYTQWDGIYKKKSWYRYLNVGMDIYMPCTMPYSVKLYEPICV